MAIKQVAPGVYTISTDYKAQTTSTGKSYANLYSNMKWNEWNLMYKENVRQIESGEKSRLEANKQTAAMRRELIKQAEKLENEALSLNEKMSDAKATTKALELTKTPSTPNVTRGRTETRVMSAEDTLIQNVLTANNPNATQEERDAASAAIGQAAANMDPNDIAAAQGTAAGIAQEAGLAGVDPVQYAKDRGLGLKPVQTDYDVSRGSGAGYRGAEARQIREELPQLQAQERTEAQARYRERAAQLRQQAAGIADIAAPTGNVLARTNAQQLAQQDAARMKPREAFSGLRPTTPEGGEGRALRTQQGQLGGTSDLDIFSSMSGLQPTIGEDMETVGGVGGRGSQLDQTSIGEDIQFAPSPGDVGMASTRQQRKNQYALSTIAQANENADNKEDFFKRFQGDNVPAHLSMASQLYAANRGAGNAVSASLQEINRAYGNDPDAKAAAIEAVLTYDLLDDRGSDFIS